MGPKYFYVWRPIPYSEDRRPKEGGPRIPRNAGFSVCRVEGLDDQGLHRAYRV